MKNLGFYLTFPGNCEEALNFYKECLKGEIKNLQRFETAPMPVPDNYKKKIINAEFKAEGVFFMASDGMADQPPVIGNNISLSFNITDLKEQEELFNKLSKGGKITMPLQDTFWGARFGMLTDKFGINWMLNCQK